MKKSSKVTLILACLFATAALIFLIVEIAMTIISFDAIYNKGGWDTVGGIFVYIYAILLAILATVSGSISIPFSAVNMKTVGKRWFNILLLVFAIVAVVISISLVISLPVAESIESMNRAGSSSTSSSM